MGQLNPVSPVSDAELGRRAVAANETLRVDTMHLVDTTAARTLLMPTVFDDDTVVIVVDSTGNAAANAITIDGNGQTIDGSSTVSLSTAFIVAAFARDAARGRWTRVVAPLQLDGAGGMRIFRTADIPSPAVQAFENNNIIDPAQMGYSARSLVSSTLDEKVGIRIMLTNSKVLRGIRAMHFDVVNRRMIATLYDQAGTLLETVTQASVPGDTLTDFLFPTPRTVGAAAQSTAGSNEVHLMIRVDDGAVNPRPPYFGATAPYANIGVTYPAWQAKDALLVNMLWVAGNGGPPFANLAAGNFVAVSPLWGAS